MKFISCLLLISLWPLNLYGADKNSVYSSCRQIANKLASVSLHECTQLSLEDSGFTSEQGRSLLYKEFPPLKKRQPQARILLLGGIHGDEYSSVSIMFKWLGKLQRYHSGLFHWIVAPLVNPDGLLKKKSQRVNSNNVDLNRNFPNGEGHQIALKHWINKTHKNPRRYPGEKALSEKESRWMHQLITDFKPDAIVAVHAPYGIVDFDGPPKPPTHLGPLHLHLLGTYPGSLGNFAGRHLQIPVVTVELPYAGIMPSKDEVSRIWIDLVHWLKQNVHSHHQREKNDKDSQ